MIECLRIVGNKRLGLSMINSIEITPESQTQIILGRNGSGKSTLLREFTPLPGEHVDYNEGGSKYVRIKYKGLTYELTSTFGKRGTGHHSFFVVENKEELNKGNTLAIQKELVLHHFNVNRERMDILLGVKESNFTSMSPLKRQEWLTLLSPVSLDYAFNIYGKLKGLKRDKDGVVKHHQQRLAKETKEVPSESEQHSMREQLNTLVKRSEALMEAKYSVIPSNDSTLTIESLKQRLSALLTTAKKTLSVHPSLTLNRSVRDEIEFKQHLQEVEQELSRTDGVLEHLTREYQELSQQQPKKDENLTDETIAALRKEIQSLKLAIERNAPSDQELSKLMIEPVVLGQRQDTGLLFQEAQEELIGLIREFPDNSDGRLSRERYQKGHDEIKARQQQQRADEQRRDAILSRLQQLKTCRSVACPKCSHDFRPGIDESEPDQLEQELNVLGPRIEKSGATVTKIQAYLDEVDDYRRLLNRFKQLTQSYPLLKPLWDHLLDHKIITTDPSRYVTPLLAWFSVMERIAITKELMDRRDVLTNKLRYIDEIDKGTVERVNNRLEQLNKVIEENTAQRNLLLKQKESLENFGHTVQRIIENQQRLAEEFDTILKQFDRLRDDYYHNALQKESNEAQLTLGQLKHHLSQIEVRNGVLDYLTKQLSDSLQEQEDLKLLLKALDPKDGLIGRYLMGFMNNVVKFMNAIIARIWTYDLEVLPSKVNKDALDYRFPLLVEKGVSTAPDIKDGSGSQVDIVDFAFRLLVMKFLKLEDFPLYFDEFGITFDEEHRTNLNLLITNMIEVGQTPQVFYISHYMQEHSALVNADICVIDPNNITVPKTYNQHVVIN